MKIKITIGNGVNPNIPVQELEIDATLGQVVELDMARGLEITLADGSVPTEITPHPGGLKIEFEEGFFVAAKHSDDTEGEPLPQMVAVNGELFGTGALAPDGNLAELRRKSRVCTVLVFIVSIIGASLQAQVQLGAPGVGLNYRTEWQLPFTHTKNLGRYYKFVFTGAEAQADADGVLGSYSYDGFMWSKPKETKRRMNHGHGNNIDGVDMSNPSGNTPTGRTETDPNFDDEKDLGKKSTNSGNGTTGTSGTTEGGEGEAEPVIGWWSFATAVNQYRISGLEYQTIKLNDASDVIRIMLAQPIVLDEDTIQLSWGGDGNSQDPDGHLYILGSAIKTPPVPTGTLYLAQTVYIEGAKPVSPGISPEDKKKFTRR